MKRFLIATALAACLAVATSGSAQAQIVYGYSIPTYGGAETGGVIASGLNTTTFTNSYSPFTGITGQTLTTGINGTAALQTYGYNPYTGALMSSTYYRPSYNTINPLTNPFYSYTNPYTGITYRGRR
jgi:hypothetical protein